MSLNCGIKALEQMSTLKDVSMFTLIHFARDNGVNLYFCQVDQDDLLKVARPAIFHQKNHFVFIEDGKVLPEGEYSGYVLTPKPPNEPLPHSLAKKVRGGKFGEGLSSFAPIITGAASVINPLLGAAVGAGFGYQKARENKEWWRIPLGAATGYLQGSPGSMFGVGKAALAGGLAAAGEVPGAIKSGDWMKPVTAGIGQYAGAKFLQGAGAGFRGAAEGAGITQRIGEGISGGMRSLTGGSRAVPGQEGYGATTPAGTINRGTFSQLPGMGGGPGGLAGTAGMGQGGNIPGMGGGFAGLGGTQLIGAGLSAMLPQPKAEFDTLGDYSKAAQFMGLDEFKSLPNATRAQLEKYVDTPLDQLAEEFTLQDDKGLRMLEEQQEKQVSSLMSTYANYGQDPYTSSEAQQRLTEVNRQYDQAKAEYQQQIQNQAMTRAISFKQEILQKSMTQGQFDYESAMELATYIGKDKEMQFALESNNQEALQQLLTQIFSVGR